ncbi:MAG: sugar transferase [Gemmatimonadaceae bacterium]
MATTFCVVTSVSYALADSRKLSKSTAKSSEVEIVSLRPESAHFGAPFRTLVVGSISDVPRALEHPAIGSRARFDVVCVLPVDADHVTVPRATIANLITTNTADTILVAGPISRGAMDELGELAVTMACRLLVVMPSPVPRLHDPIVVWEGDYPLIQLAVSRDRGVRNAFKRGFDVMASLGALIVAAPILAIAAIAVRGTSAGGAFFGHERVGLNGRRFRCWKIRTMSVDAEQRLRADPALHENYRNNSFKLPEHIDPRITRIGRFLRQTSIDELPQLWNVLKGEMSLVGPRPLIAEELQHFSGSVLTLLSVRPGMTGAWAVNGRHRLLYPKRAEVELDYVRNCSLKTDAMILIRTAAAVVDFTTDTQ